MDFLGHHPASLHSRQPLPKRCPCSPCRRARVLGAVCQRAPQRHGLCHRQQRQQGQAVGPGHTNMRTGGPARDVGLCCADRSKLCCCSRCSRETCCEERVAGPSSCLLTRPAMRPAAALPGCIPYPPLYALPCHGCLPTPPAVTLLPARPSLPIADLQRAHRPSVERAVPARWRPPGLGVGRPHGVPL